MSKKGQNRADAAALADEMRRQGCVGSRVDQLHRQVSRRYEQALRPTGLSLPQLEILSALMSWGEPARPADVADALSIERSTMSRNLALMEQRGLVTAKTTSPTGRLMTVTISAAGIHALASARTAWRSAQSSVLATLGKDTPAILASWISQLR
jgi:DNA-binding MarR family transcriptional regulator